MHKYKNRVQYADAFYYNYNMNQPLVFIFMSRYLSGVSLDTNVVSPETTLQFNEMQNKTEQELCILHKTHIFYTDIDIIQITFCHRKM